MIYFLVLFAGCQREFSLEGVAQASGSLAADPSGDCMPAKVNGIYKAGTVLNNTNTVDVTLNISAPGAYFITTDTVNGYAFSGNGTADSSGLYTVTLQSRGKPLAAGTNRFTVRFDSSVCVLEVAALASGTAAATFKLVAGGAPPNCASAVVQGIYTLGALTDVSHYADVQVNVSTPGTYTLSAAGSGLLFSASGAFTTTGVQTVRLRASGAVTVQGTTDINFAAPFSTCSFPLTVMGPATYTLDCAAATVQGLYTDGVGLDLSNTVTIPVTVTVAGTYKVTTTSRGMLFADSGTLALGPQIIVLRGSGIPNTWGVVLLSVGSSGCIIPIPVQGTTGSKIWRATIGGVLHEGPINSSATLQVGSLYTLNLYGISQVPVTTYNFRLTLTKTLTPASPGVTGTFNSLWTLIEGRAAFSLNNPAVSGFLADTAVGNFTVLRPVEREGTFSGTVQDASGALVPLVDGYFRY